jgi:hypothetical protein
MPPAWLLLLAFAGSLPLSSSFVVAVAIAADGVVEVSDVDEVDALAVVVDDDVVAVDVPVLDMRGSSLFDSCHNASAFIVIAE